MRRLLAPALLCAAPLLCATAAHAGPAEDAVMQPIQAFITALSAGDVKAAAATMTKTQTITDEFAPYHWAGPKALATWFAGEDADAKANGVTDPAITLAKPLHISITGTHAYAVVPSTYTYLEHGKKTTETALFTISLEKGTGGWLMSAWSYGLE